MKKKYDIIIVGAGVVGCALACALARQTQLSILILDKNNVDPAWDASLYQPRVSAISLASERMLKALNCWDTILNYRVSPFKQITVLDAEALHSIHFSAAQIAEPYLGHIIENNVLQLALNQEIAQLSQIKRMSPVELLKLEHDVNEMVLHTTEDQFAAKLIVGADGANSWVRQHEQFDLEKSHYAQQAIVANVHIEHSHAQTAWQQFLPDGPLALLPLTDEHMCSIVWSLPEEEARRLLALNDEAFNVALMRATSTLFGKITVQEKRYAFPLFRQRVLEYVKPGIALVGDAAHTVHPLAGQGLNMGLLDAASLAEIIANASHARRNYASLSTLRKYERWRKAENFGLYYGIDAIKHLFAYQFDAFNKLRGLGIKMVENNMIIKKFFTAYAVGNHQGMPRIANK